MIVAPEPDAARLHGGHLEAAIARFGGARADWLDLSTGINPAPPPLPDIPADAFTRLPEAGAEARLEAAARRFYSVPGTAALLAAPGSQVLISLFPHLLPPGLACVVEPTYGEHRRGLAAAGHSIVGVERLDDVPEAARVVVVVNPNNPDGRIVPRAALRALCDRLARRDGWLVVDEAFADLDGGESVAAEAGRPGLLVHRSFGKVFGYAGLRLGFALTTAEMAARLGARLGPWAVSGPALHVGAALMEDHCGLAAVRAAVRKQAAWRDAAIHAASLPILGATSLFALLSHPRAGAIFEALGAARILTRPFATRPDWLRIGNPADAAQGERLRAALAGALSAHPA